MSTESYYDWSWLITHTRKMIWSCGRCTAIKLRTFVQCLTNGDYCSVHTAVHIIRSGVLHQSGVKWCSIELDIILGFTGCLFLSLHCLSLCNLCVTHTIKQSINTQQRPKTTHSQCLHCHIRNAMPKSFHDRA